ncbi:MAG TPA: hypothetical protein VFN13_10785 [Rudaea sp.]|nr:hypothetical protein [Rudaea sp.]
MALVTLKTAATGAITDLAALTMHGDLERHTCRSWAGRTASSIKSNHWTFEPATVNGKPVPSAVIVPVVLTAHANDSLDSSSIPNGALHVVRVSPSEPPSAGNVPALENVEFRRMHPPRHSAAKLKAKQHGKVVPKVFVDARGNPKEATV